MAVQLLDRTGQKLRPTEAGEAYLRHVRRALDELEVGGRAIRDVQDLSSGALRLGFTPSFAIHLLAPLIKRYPDLFPGIVLTVTEMSKVLPQVTARSAAPFGCRHQEFTDWCGIAPLADVLQRKSLNSSEKVGSSSVNPLSESGRAICHRRAI